MAGVGNKKGNPLGAGRKRGVDASRMIKAAAKARGHESLRLWQEVYDMAVDKKHPQQLQAAMGLLKKIAPDLKAVDAKVEGTVDGVFQVVITNPDAD